MIAIDLFSGAGGMSLGAKMAGIDVRLAVDDDCHAASTYSFNHPGTEMIVEDIHKIKKVDVNTIGQEKVLFGGPPCQGFSTSNQRTRNIENRSNWLCVEFIRIVKLWKPDWVVFENVQGLVETAATSVTTSSNLTSDQSCICQCLLYIFQEPAIFYSPALADAI
jgi:DNA (cytosine-5)-methyltransferase 1